MSAYACEPGKGSEPEVGWQWALQMARYHDVTVLTRENNREPIEKALVKLQGGQPLPRFVYHDRGPFILDLKRRAGLIKLYYVLWQRSARDLIDRLHRTNHYDLMHHVTFAGFRYPAAIWGHGVPCVWGPVGGIESIPRSLLPWKHLPSLAYELSRNVNNLWQATPFHVLPKRAGATTSILVSTREMQETFKRLGFESTVMPTIGINAAELPCQPHRKAAGPLKLLFVGNIITLKGVDLALEALKQSETTAELTLVGDGNYLETAKSMVQNLGLGSRVKFQGRLPRAEVLKLYPGFDVFLFPSLHDTGGYAVIEAMFNELPVICLDCGGPAVAVADGCGTRISLGPRAKVIANLAQAIRRYDQDRPAVMEQGKAARQMVMREYDWNQKGTVMHKCYQQTIARHRESDSKSQTHRYSGMGNIANFAHRMLSLSGLAAAALGLVLVGALGFLSVAHLKRQAHSIVADTLPGLSMAGRASASMAQGFNRVLLLVLADDPEQKTKLQHEIEAQSEVTSSSLALYQQAIYEREDKALFRRLTECRQRYLETRQRVLNLAEQNQRQAALALYQRELLPTYLEHKDAGDKLFDYNLRQSQARGESIMRVCTVTQWVVAGIGIIVFLIGFVIGLFK